MKTIKVFSMAALAALSIAALASCGGETTTTPAVSTPATSTPAPTTPSATTPGTTTPVTTTPGGSVINRQDSALPSEGQIDYSKVSNKEIKFFNTCGQTLQNVIQIAIDKFQAAFPGWTVTSSQIGSYDDVYSSCVTNLQANTQPDIAYCYPDHVATYMTSGKVLDLNADFISKKSYVVDGSGNQISVGYTAEELADFIPGYYNEGKAPGFADYDKYGYKESTMFTMPFSKSTELMYYNEDALVAAGFVNADGSVKLPKTWDELWNDYCPKLSEKYPNALPFCYDSADNWVINMAKQNGWNYTSANAPYYTFKDDAKLAAWLDSLYGYYMDDMFFETKDTYGGYTSALFTKGVEEGGCIFCVGSSGGASYQKTDNFKWGIAPIPGSNVNGTINNSVISQGPSLVMFDTGDDVKEMMSWIFVKMILEPVFQAQFSMSSGYNPVRSSSYDLTDYAEWLEGEDITAVAAKVSSTLQNDFYTSPVFPGSAQARTAIGEALTYVILGEKDAAKALNDAYKQCGGK